MSDLTFALRWAISGVAIGLFAFSFNYWMVPVSLPGYEILAAPAMLALQFFSEETPFWPKLTIFLTGQYLGYLALIFALRKLLRISRKK